MDQEQHTTEVHDTAARDAGTSVRRQTVTHTAVASGNTVMSRVVWYIAGFIIALLVIRVFLYLFAANQAAPFVDFMYTISGVFALPFYGIFAQPSYGQSVLDSASIVAIVVYALVAWGISKLLTLTSAR